MDTLTLPLKITVDEHLFIKDPADTAVGGKLLHCALELIGEDGFENFTFRRLANEAGTTEATVYRYFENKQMLFSYLVAWYWNSLHLQVLIRTRSIRNAEKKIDEIIRLLIQPVAIPGDLYSGREQKLFRIVVHESPRIFAFKTDSTAEVGKARLHAYQRFINVFAAAIQEFRPAYPYPNMLAVAAAESAHLQLLIAEATPELTLPEMHRKNTLFQFLKTLINTQ